MKLVVSTILVLVIALIMFSLWRNDNENWRNDNELLRIRAEETVQANIANATPLPTPMGADACMAYAQSQGLSATYVLEDCYIINPNGTYTEVR